MILPGPGTPFAVAGLVLLEWDGVWLHRLGRWLLDAIGASHGLDASVWAGAPASAHPKRVMSGQ
jgi:hypothetical protein